MEEIQEQIICAATYVMEYSKDYLLELESRANDIVNGYGYAAYLLMDEKGLPICSVGVMGDSREYSPVVMIRGKYDPPVIREVSSRIINEVKGLSRVILEIN